MSTGSGLEWLSRAAELQACPLCVAAREFEREYLREFCQSLAEPGQHVADFVRGPGFCLDHARKLEQAVLRGNAPMPGSVDLYLRTLESLVDHMSALEQDEWLVTAQCPVCANRDRMMVVAARAFVAAVDRVPWVADETLRAGGLCIGHFILTWVDSEEGAARRFLRDLQCHATADLIRHLRGLR